jgi:hypothetical protein
MILVIPNSNNLEKYIKVFQNEIFNNKVMLCLSNLIPSSLQKNITRKSSFFMEKKNDNFLKFIFLFIANFLIISKILFFNKIEKIILVDDRTGSFILILLKLSKLFGIKSYILNNDHPAKRTNLILNRKNNKNYTSKYNLLNNKFSLKSGSKFISFYKFYENFIFQLFNILPKNPWYFGNGNSDYIYFFNINHKKILISSGVPKKKLIKYPDIKFQDLKKNFKNFKSDFDNLNLKYKLSNKPIVFFTLSHWLEHNIYNAEKHWKLNIDILDKITHHLENKTNLLLLLHPKQSYNNYKWLEKKYKIKIVKENSTNVLQFGSALIVSQSSSIVEIASLLKVKLFIILVDKKFKNYNNFFKHSSLTKDIHFKKLKNIKKINIYKRNRNIFT